jgi:2'-5' RNA ligase
MPEQQQSIRLFYALWPEQHTREQISSVAEAIAMPDIRLLKPSNLHTTLVFVGSVERSNLVALEQIGDAVSAAAFELTYDAVAHWQKPKIYCLTCSHVPDAAYKLVEQLTAAVTQRGIEIEKRPYRPHVTLARKAKLPLTMAIEAIDWSATEFVLVESISTAQGVRYDVLKRWPLTPA